MTTEHVENAPADGVNPQSVTEQTNSPIPEGTGGEAATPNAESAQQHGESPAETVTETDARPQSRAKDRIQQLIDQRRQAESERDAALSELQDLRRSAKPFNGNEYQDDASRLQAMAEHITQDAERRAAERHAKQAEQRAFHARAQAFDTRVSEFRERAPDFDQVAKNPNLHITPIMAEAITESDFGPQVSYWLGKNPAEASRIASLAPVRQIAEIGQLEARLATAPQVRKTTGAPPPPRTISGGIVSGDPDPAAMNSAQYREWRSKGGGK